MFQTTIQREIPFSWNCGLEHRLRKCVLKNCVKVFPEGGGFVNITYQEFGPTATGMIPEGGTTEEKLPSTPPPPTG